MSTSPRALFKALIPPPVLRWYRARGVLARKGARVWRGEAGGEPELRLLPALCDPARLSVDVGGNEGGYAWHMRRFSRGVAVFEPLPELAAHLARGFLFDRSVRVHQVALSDRIGTVSLRAPVSGAGVNTGLATIEAGNALGGEATRSFAVPMRTLDSYALRDVGFVKIDVEGHELAVLRGAGGLIAASRPNFLIEAQDMHRAGAVASVTELLSQVGYGGLFLLDGALHDIATFRPETHQAADALDAGLERRPGRIFINNFIFVPDAAAFRARAQALLR